MTLSLQAALVDVFLAEGSLSVGLRRAVYEQASGVGASLPGPLGTFVDGIMAGDAPSDAALSTLGYSDVQIEEITSLASLGAACRRLLAAR